MFFYLSDGKIEKIIKRNKEILEFSFTFWFMDLISVDLQSARLEFKNVSFLI